MVRSTTVNRMSETVRQVTPGARRKIIGGFAGRVKLGLVGEAGRRKSAMGAALLGAAVVAGLVGLNGCAGNQTQNVEKTTGGSTAEARTGLAELQDDGKQATGSREKGDSGDIIAANTGLDSDLLSRVVKGYESGDWMEDDPAGKDTGAASSSAGNIDPGGFAPGTRKPADSQPGRTAAADTVSPVPADAALADLQENGSVDRSTTGGVAGSSGDKTDSESQKSIQADPLSVLRQKLRDESDAPFYSSVLSVLLDVYADSGAEQFDLPATSPDLSDDELKALRYLQEFSRTIHRDVYEQDSIEPLAEAAEKLADELKQSMPMSIPTLELCSKVDGYGQYTTMPGHRFLVNRPQRVGVYVELSNFSTENLPDGQYRIEVTQTLTLYDELGTKAWEEGPHTFRDVSRNRRRDFFLAVPVYLPGLSIGRYNLKVSMRDENSGAVAEGTIPIEVVADPRLTGSDDS